jgi:hypothetical protein
VTDGDPLEALEVDELSVTVPAGTPLDTGEPAQ